jgi:hypothetical protein
MTSSTNGREPRESQRQYDGWGLSANLTLVLRAREAIEFLVAEGQDYYWAGSKAAFAAALGWFRADGETPDRRLVEDVCNLTRDQEGLSPMLQEELAGFVISYAPSVGGMTLLDPGASDMPLHHYAHILVGDMQRQQQALTTNRRRLPTWKKAGAIAANGDDHELARLFWQGENEISRTGFVTESTMGELNQVLMSREVPV